MLDVVVALNQIFPLDLATWSGLSIFIGLFVGTFVSEDAACIAAGTLAANGEISLGLAVGSCFAGIVVGDLGLYAIGRVFGRPVLLTKLVRRFGSDTSITRASEWFDRRGASAIFLSRFVTGFRLPTYLAAGFLRTDLRKFALYFILAAAIWTPLVVGSIAIFGAAFGGGALLLGFTLLLLFRFSIRLATWKGRRLFIGKLKRIVNWEFWPLAVFYFPVVCYVLWQSLRYRSLTVFTCANPSMPAGGFVGESKNDIYAHIARDPANRDHVLPHTVIGLDLPIAQRTAEARRFLEREKIEFPVVLKPDSGERGKGVRILADESELDVAIEAIDRYHILQEFVDGAEISVFYYRHPSSETGTIFSITEKIFPSVLGDGVSSIERLILRDPRAVCQAEKYFEENSEILNLIPPAGTHVPLIRIGTHSRGAIFRDGIHLNSAEFESTIDRLCRRIDGFYFGRFDIRYSSLRDLQSGRGFKIIELNGVTSESTNIYDPRYSLIDAYRILFRQWRIAFEIGQANRARGARETPASKLISDAVLAMLR